MNKISKDKIKNFWENNKEKVLIGGALTVGAVAAGLTVIYKIRHKSSDAESMGFENVLSVWKSKPSRPIPKLETFQILDIAEDTNDGCVVWLDDCKLSDCGVLGEGLSQIDGVNPEMFATMIILGKDKTESI